VRFCTVVARNYLAQARVLALSLRRVDPDAKVSVLMLDHDDEAPNVTTEPFSIVRPADLPIERREFNHMATVYDVLELATAVKPWLLEHLLVTDDVVCYLDPDIEVFRDLDEVAALALRHSIVLTPHTTSPMPRDGLFPSEQTILLAGVYNLGFIAVSRGARGFLSWWSERLRRDCRSDVARGFFVDQRWVDLVPGLFEHTLLRDPVYNVAYWNLYDREVYEGVDGYEVKGERVRFFHYSGFDPLQPYLLSKHQAGEQRIRLDEHYTLACMCLRYAAQLLEAGYLETCGLAYRYGYTSDGLRIDRRMRRMYARALEENETSGVPSSLPDPFDPAGGQEFFDWLAAPVGPPNGTHPDRISRYLRDIYDQYSNLSENFGDLAGPGGDAFLDWARDLGPTEVGIPPELTPAPEPPAHRRPTGLASGVNLVGYLRAEDGVGAVARSMLDVVRRAGEPVSLRSCGATESRQYAEPGGVVAHADDTYDVTIACVNADQLPLLRRRMGDQMPVASSTVGIWAWEVDVFPEWMARSARLVDEVWTYSRHAADAIAQACSVPVRVFAPPVEVPDDVDDVDRGDVGISDDFTFLFCFDFRSVFERKNPLAVINAFRRAFAPGEGPRLVVKSVNGDSDPVSFARMTAAAGGRRDIVIRDGYESEERQHRLMAACDCYVSLHRAEGFGLTLAEAMARAKPVIGTAYSGNLEFMTHETAVLVPFELVPIPLGAGPYPSRASWAEPDVEVAADAMRSMASDPSSARSLGAQARAHMARWHMAEHRVDLLRARLAELRSGR
jgi:glycosyltransferase involved in cell wall biosynthesis